MLDGDGRDLGDDTVEIPAISDDDEGLMTRRQVAESRDLLHLCAIQAWQALASGQPAPDLDPDLEQVIYEALVTSDSYQVDQFCEDWLDLARQCGITVDDEHGELRPDVLDAISHTMRWLGFCVMIESWTTCRQTGRKPSSGRVCTAV